jgi:diguanylate cyclase (GGDEF)-like protein
MKKGETLKKLKFLAYHDDLTKVLNRRGLLMELKLLFKIVSLPKERKFKKIQQIPFSLIFFDFDNFKEINDKYSHQAGDLVLKKSIGVLKKVLRKSDIIGRWGGEEFIIALIGCDENTAFKIAEKLREKIEKNVVNYKNKKIRITASFGVVSYRGKGTLLDLINKSDEAMYLAKKLGKNRVVVLK